MSDDIKAASQEFFVEFRQRKEAIEALLAAAAKPDSAQDGQTLVQAKTDIAALSKRVTDATLFLPLYDQRQFSLQLKVLTDAAAALNTPRAKFSFKSKKTKPVGDESAAVAEASGDGSAVAAPAADLPEPQTFPPDALVFKDIAGRIITETTLPTLVDVNANADATADATHIQDAYIYNISRSILDLRGLSALGAVHLKNVSESIVLLGPIRGSILVESCTRSLLAVICHQCRIHNSHQSKFYLHVNTNPIIEDCSQLGFAPYFAGTLETLADRIKN
eukprot:jgi/Hompol1/260/HPOL_001149-RA